VDDLGSAGNTVLGQIKLHDLLPLSLKIFKN